MSSEAPVEAALRVAQRFARLRGIAAPLISVLLIAAAGLVIHFITKDVRIHEIRGAAEAIPPGRMLLALAFTALSFTALASFEVMAVATAAPGVVSYRKAAVAGALGYAIANLLGFGVLTGGALRYRIYSAEGLDAASTLRIVVTSYLTFWLSFVAVLALALVIDPIDVVALKVLGQPAEIALGVLLLAGLAALIVWTERRPRAIEIGGWAIHLPRASVAIGQIAAGSLDIAASASVLYVLLPADVQPNLAFFLVVYAGAIVLGIISHAPAGIGVFDASIIAALGQSHGAEIIAALIVYRLIYYGLPFAIGIVGLGAFEAVQNRHWLSAAAAETTRLLRPVVPVAAGAMVCIAGLVLLVAGVRPPAEARVDVLQDLIPLPLVEMSHLLGSIAGVAMLIVARGLVLRLRTAWLATFVLLAAGAIASVVRGFDFEAAIVMTAVAAILYAFRSAFYRRSDLTELRPSPGWFAMVLAGVVAVTWLGLFSYRHVAYANELWWQFEWGGNAPRFLRATVAVCAVLVWAAVSFVIHRPGGGRFIPDPVTDTVRRLTDRAPQAQANVALLGDKKFLFAPDEAAFIMYGRVGRSFVTMGDPIGSGPAATELIWRFRELADQSGARAIYYAVTSAYLPIFLDMGLSVLKIGEVARVELAKFSLEGKKRHDFRYADRRATKEGLNFEVIPKADVPKHIAELKAVSDVWLSLKSGHEKGFSLGSFSESYLAEFDCAIMRDSEGIQAFANLWRGGGREEISVDVMRYRPQRSNILMDALFARLLLYAKDEGYRWFNLGAAPLAGMKDHPLASKWHKIGSLLYRHAEDFYHFEGLKAFKQKFEPVWSPQYIAGPGGLALPGVLFDVTSLISGGRLGVLAK